jgi:hypothetical protein
MAQHPQARARSGQRQDFKASDLPGDPVPGAGDTPAQEAPGVADPTPEASAITQGEASITGSTGDGADSAAITAGKDKRKREYTKREVLKMVPLDELGEDEEVPEEEWDSHPLVAANVADRSPQQTQIDEAFKKLLDKWKEAGEPDPRRSPRSRRVVSPEHAPAIRRMITLSAKLYDIGYFFSPPAHDKDGREVIVYSPAKKIRRPRREASSAAADRINAGEAAKAAGNKEAAELLASTVSAPSPSDGSLPGE